MKGRKKTVAVVVLMLAAFAYLIFMGLQEGTMYYLEVSEFLVKLPTIGSEKVRVNGLVKKDTFVFNSKERVLTFVLKDIKGPATLKVIYRGTPPDLVQEDKVTVVAEGSYDSQKKVFVSSKLLVKCPSKYEKQAKYEMQPKYEMQAKYEKQVAKA